MSATALSAPPQEAGSVPVSALELRGRGVSVWPRACAHAAPTPPAAALTPPDASRHRSTAPNRRPPACLAARAPPAGSLLRLPHRPPAGGSLKVERLETAHGGKARGQGPAQLIAVQRQALHERPAPSQAGDQRARQGVLAARMGRLASGAVRGRGWVLVGRGRGERTTGGWER
jgi:hypothetical protein